MQAFPGPRCPVKELRWQNTPCASHTPPQLYNEGKSWLSGRMALLLHCTKPEGHTGFYWFGWRCVELNRHRFLPQVIPVIFWIGVKKKQKGEKQKWIFQTVVITMIISKLLVLHHVHGSASEHFCEVYLPQEDESSCQIAKKKKKKFSESWSLSRVNINSRLVVLVVWVIASGMKGLRNEMLKHLDLLCRPTARTISWLNKATNKVGLKLDKHWRYMVLHCQTCCWTTFKKHALALWTHT